MRDGSVVLVMLMVPALKMLFSAAATLALRECAVLHHGVGRRAGGPAPPGLRQRGAPAAPPARPAPRSPRQVTIHFTAARARALFSFWQHPNAVVDLDRRHGFAAAGTALVGHATLRTGHCASVRGHCPASQTSSSGGRAAAMLCARLRGQQRCACQANRFRVCDTAGLQGVLRFPLGFRGHGDAQHNRLAQHALAPTDEVGASQARLIMVSTETPCT